MTTAPEHIIPGVSGWLGASDPRGWVTFEVVPVALRNGLDATLAADYVARNNVRNATLEEMALLRHLGLVLPLDLPQSDPRYRATLQTVVTYVTATLRNVSWPALTGQIPVDPTNPN